jgi:hypothetical protein
MLKPARTASADCELLLDGHEAMLAIQQTLDSFEPAPDTLERIAEIPQTCRIPLQKSGQPNPGPAIRNLEAGGMRPPLEPRRHDDGDFPQPPAIFLPLELFW